MVTSRMALETPEVSRAFHNIAKAQAAKQAMEFLDEELFGKQRDLDNIMFQKLSRGEVIDPQFAVQLWMQKWAMWQLMVKLLQVMKSGDSSSRIIAPWMNGEGEGNG